MSRGAAGQGLDERQDGVPSSTEELGAGDPMVFPERLKHMRLQRGLDQTQLAERALMPATSISLFESGRRKPSFENLKRLADALDVSVDYLMERSDDPMSHWSVTMKQARVSRLYTFLSEIETLSRQARDTFGEKA